MCWPVVAVQKEAVRRRGTRLIKRIFVVSALTGAYLFVAAPAQAAVIVVNTTLDALDDGDGDCSLREAIFNANDDAATFLNCTAGSGDDVITLPAGTFNLTLGADDDVNLVGDLDIDGNVTIQGAGDDTTIDPSAMPDRAFDILSGTVTLEDLVLAGGNGGIDDEGGAIRAATPLTLRNVLAADNAAFNGGAILMEGSPLIVEDSSFEFNGAFSGGVIRMDGGSLSVADSSFFDNGAFAGGAIDSFDADLTVVDSIFVGNGGGVAAGAILACACLTSPDVSITGSIFSLNAAGTGGAIVFEELSGASVTDSTFDQNEADDGGGIALTGTSLEISGSTFSYNEAANGGALLTSDFLGSNVIDIENSTFSGNSAGDGGALYAEDTTGTVRHVTVTRSNSLSGAIYEDSPGSLEFYNSLIVDQSSGPDCESSLGDFGGNFGSDGSCGVTGTAGPLVDLADNGGPTLTHALESGHPAIDGGIPAGCGGLTIDQRGEPRPGGSECDAGAYEFPPPPVEFSVLRVVVSGAGSVTGDSDLDIDCPTRCTDRVRENTSGTLTATPNAGSTFVSWDGCTSVSGTTCDVRVSSDKTVTATFSGGPSPSPSPTVNPSPTPDPDLVQGGRCKGYEVGSETTSPQGFLVIVGTPQDDVLTGHEGQDLICGLAGNDTIKGLKTGDGLYGGSGNDTLFGGRGPDFLHGGKGTDECSLGRDGANKKGCEN